MNTPGAPSPVARGARPCSRWAWTLAPALFVAFVLGACHLLPGRERAGLERPNFVVIDIDSLRADRVGMARAGSLIAPNLTRMAREGAWFRDVTAQAGWTLPSLGTLLNGRPPLLMELSGGAMPAAAPDDHTVPEILAMYGYTTAALWGGTIVGADARFNRGFMQTSRLTQGRHAEFGKDASNWLSNKPSEPFFLFVHEIDLHMPVPPVPREPLHRFDRALPGCLDMRLGQIEWLLEPRIGKEHARSHAIAHYDGSLSWYDSFLGEILDTLRYQRLSDRTVVILTSDHGQDLFEHLGLGHGSQYDVVLRVPLIILDPSLSGPRLISEPVQGLDLAPTILARAGIPVEVGMSGRSLLPLLGLAPGEVEKQDFFVLSHRHGAAIRSGRYKLLTRLPTESYNESPDAGRRVDRDTERLVELYDLEEDPGESVDLASSSPELRDDLLARLDSWMEGRLQRYREADWKPLDDEQRAAIRRHGYWNLVDPEGVEAASSAGAPGRPGPGGPPARRRKAPR